ncbi:MAG: glycosyltransferase family 4 protein [Thermoplasmata archaeon]
MYSILSTGAIPILPANYGGARGIYSLLHALSLSRKVIYLYPEKTNSTRKINENFMLIGVKQKSWKKFVVKSAIGLFRLFGTLPNSPLSHEIRIFIDRKYREKVRELLNADKDTVLLFQSPGGLFSLMEEVGDRIKILRAHNVEMHFYKAHYSTGNKFRERITDEIIEKLEGEFARKCDLVFCITPEDSKFFHIHYGVPYEKIVWVPFPVDAIRIKSWEEKKSQSSQKKKICVLMSGFGLRGKSKVDPNAEVANTLLQSLARRYPDVDFVVMGKICSAITTDAKNIKLLGVVDDPMKEHILQIADMAINPTVAGAGINIKMLEYMAYGLPVVTTPIGARGTFVKDGESAVIRKIENFEDGLEFLLSDDQKAKEIGMNARKIINQYFDAKVVAERAVAAIDRVWQSKYGK